MPSKAQRPASGDAIPSTFAHPGAARFWSAVVLTGVATGIAAAVLTRLLEAVQRFAWGGSGSDLLKAARQASPSRHILCLLSTSDAADDLLCVDLGGRRII